MHELRNKTQCRVDRGCTALAFENDTDVSERLGRQLDPVSEPPEATQGDLIPGHFGIKAVMCIYLL
jgi:hypothetical protein